MRRLVLAEAWKDHLMRPMSKSYDHQIWSKLLSECVILLRNPHLAACVRYGSPFAVCVSDASSDHLKDLDSGSRGGDLQSNETLCQMPCCPTQPPRPRDRCDVEVRGHRCL